MSIAKTTRPHLLTREAAAARIEKLELDLAFCREAMRHADIDLSMVLPLANSDMQKSIRKTLDTIDEARKRSLGAPVIASAVGTGSKT